KVDQGFFCRIRGVDGVPQNCEVAAKSPPLAAGRTDARNGPACVGRLFVRDDNPNSRQCESCTADAMPRNREPEEPKPANVTAEPPARCWRELAVSRGMRAGRLQRVVRAGACRGAWQWHGCSAVRLPTRRPSRGTSREFGV